MLSDVDRSSSCFDGKPKTTPNDYGSTKLTVVYDPQNRLRSSTTEILLMKSRMPEFGDAGQLSRWSHRAAGMYHLYATRRNEILKAAYLKLALVAVFTIRSRRQVRRVAVTSFARTRSATSRLFEVENSAPSSNCTSFHRHRLCVVRSLEHDVAMGNSKGKEEVGICDGTRCGCTIPRCDFAHSPIDAIITYTSRHNRYDTSAGSRK
jgi:hypothetical protein